MFIWYERTCIPSLPSTYKLRSSLILGVSNEFIWSSVFPSMAPKQPNFSCTISSSFLSHIIELNVIRIEQRTQFPINIPEFYASQTEFKARAPPTTRRRKLRHCNKNTKIMIWPTTINTWKRLLQLKQHDW